MNGHSVQDGYAVIAADGEGTYPVVGDARAGAGIDISLQAGQVAYITTGAPLPAGADAVIQVEDTELSCEGDSLRVTILKAASNPGQDIRTVGSDIGCARLSTGCQTCSTYAVQHSSKGSPLQHGP